jgi:hypothetical protein
MSWPYGLGPGHLTALGMMMSFVKLNLIYFKKNEINPKICHRLQLNTLPLNSEPIIQTRKPLEHNPSRKMKTQKLYLTAFRMMDPKKNLEAPKIWRPWTVGLLALIIIT